MMELLSKITKLAIDNNLFSYDDLFTLTEDKIFNILDNSDNKEIQELLLKFYHIEKDDIPEIYRNKYADRKKPWGTGQAILCCKDV